MNIFKKTWHTCREFLLRHACKIKHGAHVSHLAYFALVAIGGPYYAPAGICFVLGIAGWILHIELES